MPHTKNVVTASTVIDFSRMRYTPVQVKGWVLATMTIGTDVLTSLRIGCGSGSRPATITFPNNGRILQIIKI